MTAPKSPQSLSDRVLSRIEDEHVVPHSRSRFVVRNVVFWVMWGVCVLFGATTVAAAVFVFTHSGWSSYVATHGTFLAFLLDVLPLFWIGALFVFTLFAYETMRNTDHGYRFSLPVILAATLPASLVLGGVLATIGVGEHVENRVSQVVPFHAPITERQEELWNQPEQGLLAGKVTSVNREERVFELMTFAGGLWTISSDDLRPRDLQTLERMSRVRVVGVPTEDGKVFHACFVLPWVFSGPEDQERPPFVFCDEMCERRMDRERSSECKGLRPYVQLEHLQRTP